MKLINIFCCFLAIVAIANAYVAGPCESLVGSGTPECLTSEVCGDNNECSPTAGSCEDGQCLGVMGDPAPCETATNKCGDVFCPGVTADGTCFCSGGTCLQLELPCPTQTWGNGGACVEEGGGFGGSEGSGGSGGSSTSSTAAVHPILAIAVVYFGTFAFTF